VLARQLVRTDPSGDQEGGKRKGKERPSECFGDATKPHQYSFEISKADAWGGTTVQSFTMQGEHY
jgi:hypothetical protein